MIVYETEAGSPVVEIRLEGRLTEPDMRAAMLRLESDIARNGKSRVLERIERFTGMEPAAFWTDLRLGPPLVNRIERAAVVADAAWIRAVTDLGGVFVHPEVRTFRPDELEAARAWVGGDN